MSSDHSGVVATRADVDAIERQHEVVQDAQPAAARRQHRAGVEAERRVHRVRAVLLQRRARVGVPQLQPPRPGEVEDRVQVAELRAGDLEERTRPLLGLAPGGGGGGSFLGASAAMNPIPSLFFIAANRQSATGTRRSWMEKLPPATSVRSLTFASRCGTSRTTVPSGSMICRPSTRDRRRLVGDDVDQRAQPPGDAADLQLPLLLGERRFDQLPEPRPLQHDGGARAPRPQSSPPGRGPCFEVTRTSARSRQGTIIVARSRRFRVARSDGRALQIRADVACYTSASRGR